MLNWVKQFNISCFLDNNNYDSPSFECLLAVAKDQYIELTAGKAYHLLQQFHEQHPGWLFGHFAYDLKNEDPSLYSRHENHINFPDAFFFSPEILITINAGIITIQGDFPENVYKEIIETEISPSNNVIPAIQQLTSKKEYIDTFNKLIEHIHRGDCYEINFCQEFYIQQCIIDVVEIYLKLINVSPNPFSALYRINDKFCLCASPERYLMKKGQLLVSQPIKGTSKRFSNKALDENSFEELKQSGKDKSENVMIVDLVRNDLSRICERNSVKVTSLFEIKKFPQVYQMISTVEGIMKNRHWTEAIKATFPMGSMTGAPKKKVMQLIELYEKSNRGLFSGSIGYVTPEGDFDFNVVIRSIFYNNSNQYLSFMAGGGITANSDGENEYEECLMKVKAIVEILSD